MLELVVNRDSNGLQELDAGEFWIFVVKLLRAHGGCLGVRRR